MTFPFKYDEVTTTLTEEDAGTMLIGQTDDGKVFLGFPEPLRCMGFTPAQARSFAAKLVEQAEMIENGIKIRTQ